MGKTVTMEYAEHQALIRAKLCVLNIRERWIDGGDTAHIIEEYKLCDNIGEVREILLSYTGQVSRFERREKALHKEILMLKAEVKLLKTKKWWEIWRKRRKIDGGKFEK